MNLVFLARYSGTANRLQTIMIDEIPNTAIAGITSIMANPDSFSKANMAKMTAKATTAIGRKANTGTIVAHTIEKI